MSLEWNKGVFALKMAKVLGTQSMHRCYCTKMSCFLYAFAKSQTKPIFKDMCRVPPEPNFSVTEGLANMPSGPLKVPHRGKGELTPAVPPTTKMYCHFLLLLLLFLCGMTKGCCMQFGFFASNSVGLDCGLKQILIWFNWHSSFHSGKCSLGES